ncbi:hypothetical protein ACOMHN_065949 [Nucella lapillus]
MKGCRCRPGTSHWGCGGLRGCPCQRMALEPASQLIDERMSVPIGDLLLGVRGLEKILYPRGLAHSHPHPETWDWEASPDPERMTQMLGVWLL